MKLVLKIMIFVLFVVLILECSGCSTKATIDTTDTSKKEGKPNVIDATNEYSIYLRYKSHNGDQIYVSGSIVWVEDIYGNIKAVARH